MLGKPHVSIAGNGNVGTYLFHQFTKSGFQVEWFGRPLAKNIRIIDWLFENSAKTDLLLLCISDDAITEVSRKIQSFDGIIAHVSGVQCIETISNHHTKRGVFYPLMSIKKDLSLPVSKIPFCLEADQKSDLEVLENIVKELGAEFYWINSQQRIYLHLAAVFSHNFSNHLYHKAQKVLYEQNQDFKILIPLLENAVQKLHEKPARDLQTGPAIRYDQKTIGKHLSLLNDNMSRDIYKLLTESIQSTYDEKL